MTVVLWLPTFVHVVSFIWTGSRYYFILFCNKYIEKRPSRTKTVLILFFPFENKNEIFVCVYAKENEKIFCISFFFFFIKRKLILYLIYFCAKRKSYPRVEFGLRFGLSVFVMYLLCETWSCWWKWKNIYPILVVCVAYM